MRLAYFGTSEFAAAVLRRLAEHPERRPRLVVTPPDRPRGRGRRIGPVPAAAAAEELGIEVLRTEATEAPEALERIRAAELELGVVCAFGQLLKEPLLSELELLNVHPSLLPRWRGAAPIERSIMAGDVETGVSIMRVTAGLDSGPVAVQEAIAIGDQDYGALAPRLEDLAGRLLAEALERRSRGELELVDQDDGAATYAEKIEPAERRLDPALTAIELERRVRALTPHIGAYLELEDGERLGVIEARAEAGKLEPGSLADADGLRLGCGEGTLRLVRVRPSGGRTMDAEAYLRGHPLPEL
ncbi:MAG: methionyl-tRNA formyltransferase [Solirubrobacterales bacterium]|nr:methionyl-tRNA formyltransferase [Solirubrobacterales bacterium]